MVNVRQWSAVCARFNVSQVTAYVAFLFCTWAASTRLFSVAPCCFWLSLRSRDSTATAACSSTTEAQCQPSARCRDDVVAVGSWALLGGAEDEACDGAFFAFFATGLTRSGLSGTSGTCFLRFVATMTSAHGVRVTP
jgi:hypothetical protein